MSVYLARASDAEEDVQTCYTHFALAVSNHEDPTLYITSHAYHNFTKTKADFGFTYLDTKKRLIARQSIVLETRLQVSVFLRVFTRAHDCGNTNSEENSSLLPKSDAQKQPVSVKDASAFVAENMPDPVRDLQSSTLRVKKWSEGSEELKGEEF
ncbi:hypothetical protein PQX77_017101, partial [Marasmius sp. AFHP31]